MKDSAHAESFLSRWSRRKLASAREPHGDTGNGKEAAAPRDARHVAGPAGTAAPEAAAAPSPTQALNRDGDAAVTGGHGTTAAPAAGAPAALGSNGEPARLPPVESLSFDSDFTGFMAPGVDPAVRRAALRKLLHDPRFNVMDGLDVYIDDYTQPSPIAPEVVRQLAHARYLFDPPRTRINAQGQVEDVPDDVPEAAGAAVEGEVPDAASRDAGDDAPATASLAGEDERASDMTCTQADAAPARLPITGESA